MLQMSIFSEERPIKVCVFTGHRDLQSDFSKKKLKEAVKELEGPLYRFARKVIEWMKTF